MSTRQRNIKILPKREIICTLGPSSMNKRVIVRLQELGVSLFRINLSHTGLRDVSRCISFIQSNTSVPVCIDTEGAQIRTGVLQNGEVYLAENSNVCISRNYIVGNSNSFNLYPLDIVDKLEKSDFISFDFNSVIGQVTDKNPEYMVVKILSAGVVGQNKAVSVDRDIVMPSLTKKDRESLVIAAKMGVQYVALSFANQASDIDEIHAVYGKDVFVIAKIESIKGVVNLEQIAAKSNALLLDRGDLSRQVPIEMVPRLQKDIIQRVKNYGKKIYVATNLLESMVTKLTQTRAEVNDVYNTLNDGADGLVLAAETAIGDYPINCVLMVSRIIKDFLNSPEEYSFKGTQRKAYSLLVEPHGGVLINKVNNNFDLQEIWHYKTLKVDKTVLMDAEQIAIGSFSPLTGFMNKETLESVIKDYQLPNGIVWTVPITLQTNKKNTCRFKAGDNIALVLEDTSESYAILHLEEIYAYNLDKLCEGIFGTNKNNHPGVLMVKNKGNYFLAGEIELIQYLPSDYKHFELRPHQARVIFENKGWDRVVGFYARNANHRVYEYIQKCALEEYHCDGLFVHPAAGNKETEIYSADTVFKTYELMINECYSKGKAVLGIFQSYPRYCGLREVVFSALCRKNFGCSHFIIDKSHAKTDNYYKPYDAKKIFNYLGDIGIVPIFLNTMHFSKQHN